MRKIMTLLYKIGMKNILTTTLLFVTSLVFSQNCSICGDWTGRYGKYNDDDSFEYVKIIIRIKQNGDNAFSVRVKRIFDNGNIIYEDKFEIDYDTTKPNEMFFSEQLGEAYANGICDNKYKYNQIRTFELYEAKFNNNEMTVKFFFRLVYYEDWYVCCHYDREPTIVRLFKDDDDW